MTFIREFFLQATLSFESLDIMDFEFLKFVKWYLNSFDDVSTYLLQLLCHPRSPYPLSNHLQVCGSKCALFAELLLSIFSSYHSASFSAILKDLWKVSTFSVDLFFVSSLVNFL